MTAARDESNDDVPALNTNALDAEDIEEMRRQKHVDRLLRDEPRHYAGLYDQQRNC